MLPKADFDVCVIGGCGHVGLTLSLSLSNVSQRVVAFDINQSVVAKVNDGIMPFIEKGAQEILSRVTGKNFWATTDPSVIAKANYVVLVTGTPVDRHLNPRIQDVLDVIDSNKGYFRDGQTIILRSTLYPGTSEKINERFLNLGLNVHVTFCPERVAEGYAIEEISSLPQIISGFTDEGIRRATDLFGLLAKETVELKPIEAELAKLFTNTWRYIQFAVPNQFFMIANDYGLDYYKILDAMKHNYPRAKGLAGAGFCAGPCLYKDTMQLACFHDNHFFLGHSAMLVNEGLPNYIVGRLKRNPTWKEKPIGILGMSFKGESDDPRESLAYKLRKVLQVEGATVFCTDEYVKDQTFLPLEEVLDKTDTVIIGTPHKRYRSVDLSGHKVVDIWNLRGEGSIT